MTLPPVKLPRKHRPKGLEILYEDRDIIVVNKESGVLTIATQRDEAFTAENVLNDYVRKGCACSPKHVFLVHRLDRETSGVLLFAKSEQAQEALKANWKNNDKFYLTAVYGHLKEKSGVFSSYLAEGEDLFVRSVINPAFGKFSQTAYAVIQETPTLSLVKIRLLTGRRNQIRVQFADHGHPLVGDARYGDHDPFRERLCLHAKSIAFDHPHNGKRMTFDTPIPDVFQRLCPRLDETAWLATAVPEGTRQPDDDSPDEEAPLHEKKPTPRPATFHPRPAFRRR